MNRPVEIPETMQELDYKIVYDAFHSFKGAENLNGRQARLAFRYLERDHQFLQHHNHGKDGIYYSVQEYNL